MTETPMPEGCPDCGGPVGSSLEGNSVLLRCTRCDWSAAATAPETLSDARGRLYISAAEPPEPSRLVAVARSCGMNALEVRRGLEAGPLLVASGYLDEIEPLRAELAELGLRTHLERVE